MLSNKTLVNLGCGNTFLNNWINIDFSSDYDNVLKHDLTTGIPLEDNSVDFLYSSHVLEHFNKKDAVSFLLECKRVLKEEGIIRIVVPNLHQVVLEYLNAFDNYKSSPSEISKADFDWASIELLDQMVREESGGEMLKYLQQENILNTFTITKRIGKSFLGLNKKTTQKSKEKTNLNDFVKKNLLKLIGINWNEYQFLKFRRIGENHKWMYDELSLSYLLKKNGFNKITIQSGDTSMLENWEDHSSLDMQDNSLRKPDSIIIEAVK